MAGDWIKMQGNLWTNPKVVRIMSATKADRCRVIGALFRVWCLFDEHTEDGILEGYTKFLLDDELRIDGFSEAMESVDWLIDNNGESLQVPDFDDHMSKSAKKRAQDTKRKREGRKMSASQADKNTTREEKRREEKNNKKTNKKNDDFSYRQIPNLNIEAWEAWLENRRLRKLPKYKTNQCANSLAEFTHKEQADAVAQSIKQEYTGVFPKKASQSSNPVDRRQQAIDDFVNGGSVISEQ